MVQQLTESPPSLTQAMSVDDKEDEEELCPIHAHMVADREKKKGPTPLLYIRVIMPADTQSYTHFYNTVERALLHKNIVQCSTPCITIVFSSPHSSERWFHAFLQRLSTGCYRDIASLCHITQLSPQSISFLSGVRITTADSSQCNLPYFGTLLCMIRDSQELPLFSSFFQRHLGQRPIMICFPNGVFASSFLCQCPCMSLTWHNPNDDSSLSASFQSISLV